MLPGVDCALSIAPNHPDLQVTKFLGVRCKLRKSFLIAGISPEINYATFNTSIDAAECAIKERVFFVEKDGMFLPPPRPVTGLYVDVLHKVFKIFKKHSEFCNPMRAEQFARSYQAPKLGMYLRAVDSLERKPLENKDAHIKAFMKYEKYNFKPGKKVVPRIISPRSPRFTVSLGRFVKPIEKKIYTIVNDNLFDSPTIMKGLNQSQRGQVIFDHWNDFTNPVAIGIDAKRFDQHVSLEALKWEHAVYKLFYPGSKEFSRLLKYQERNKCFVNLLDGTAKYTTTGGRMSGDVNTALGNCLLSCSLVYAYADEVGVRIKLVNDGDDCVIFMEKETETKFRSGLVDWFTRMGFTMEVEDTVFEIEHISFCQSQPIFDGEGYIMVRDPRTSITKDSVALKPLDNHKVAKMWMASIGKCGLSLTGGIPVLQHFYLMLIRGSEGAKSLVDPTIGTYRDLTIGMKRETINHIGSLTRFSFWLAFGITPEEQIAIENFYSTTSLVSTIVEHQSHVSLPI
jgi:hypothetical protein